ncbi:uncharacterized protein BP5553_03516 [Venustampulla echinocandica]|uniref:Uncharacterized protein n=1 Tax=Venustampulla echinocandica TaxID=2656787 RepID=A0A370TUI0_9HELO|nr:uncharacterized protein BP5553_03516 [Venustampulla echinocandica]RDL39176.1 hypothetical protein BP5553_03516 [Venustampulla echinocandica]
MHLTRAIVGAVLASSANALAYDTTPSSGQTSESISTDSNALPIILREANPTSIGLVATAPEEILYSNGTEPSAATATAIQNPSSFLTSASIAESFPSIIISPSGEALTSSPTAPVTPEGRFAFLNARQAVERQNQNGPIMPPPALRTRTHRRRYANSSMPTSTPTSTPTLTPTSYNIDILPWKTLLIDDLSHMPRGALLIDDLTYIMPR